MVENQNLVSVMIAQHRVLQKDLGAVLVLADDGKEKCDAVDILLKQFHNDLVVHLELENNTFYKELLQKMKAKNQDTTKTEQFIAEMNIIAKEVTNFLEKYNGCENISRNIDVFKPELTEIISILNLRIESEESGVYAYWGLF
jgi:hypothetical protein